MCVFIENVIKKKNAKVAVGLQLSNGYLLPKPKKCSFSIYPAQKINKNKRAPKMTSFWGPLRDKKKGNGLLTPAGLNNGRPLPFPRCTLSARPPTLSPLFSFPAANCCNCSKDVKRKFVGKGPIENFYLNEAYTASHRGDSGYSNAKAVANSAMPNFYSEGEISNVCINTFFLFLNSGSFIK